MAKIELTNSQIMMAATAGVIRRVQFIARDGKPTHGLKDEDNNWNLKIEGALSEYALAQYLNIHWMGAGVVGGNDVGEEEVRVTDLEHGRLIIRESDKNHKRYWLLTGKDGTYYVRGYIYAKDAKQPQYFTDAGNGREKAWFVPQKDLRNDQR
jgi:hypothetical protein